MQSAEVKTMKLHVLPRGLRRLTDQEYVEQARKAVKASQRWGRWLFAIQILGGVGYFVLALGILNIVFWGADVLGLRIGAGLGLGIGFGTVAGYMMLHGYHHVIQACSCLGGHRESELLVRYHDALAFLADSEMNDSAGSSDLPNGPRTPGLATTTQRVPNRLPLPTSD